jgi:hypothetical protein
MVKNLTYYKDGKIYAILCYSDLNVLYIGSTKSPLKVRFGCHISNYKNGSTKNCLLHKAVEEDPLGWANYYIILIENYPCNSRTELENREGVFQRNMSTTLNKNIAGRTKKEWMETHKEECKLHQKKCYLKNQEERKLYQRNFYLAHQEERKLYQNNFYLAHQEERKLYRRNFYKIYKK